MRYDSIADIYSANEKFRLALISTLERASPDEAAAQSADEKWSIRHIAEHLSLVDFGISRICSKLLDAARAANKPSTGGFRLPETFGERTEGAAGLKLEAPERVQPTGNTSVSESIAKINSNHDAYDSMRDDFEKFDLTGPTFPHPFLGELTAGEWLVMAGMHQHRHTLQIEKLLEKIRG